MKVENIISLLTSLAIGLGVFIFNDMNKNIEILNNRMLSVIIKVENHELRVTKLEEIRK